MTSVFDNTHWNRVKQARAAQGINRIPEEALLRPGHRLARATLQHRATGDAWAVVAVREEWQLGRYLSATLERDGQKQTAVIEVISCEDLNIVEQLGQFNDQFTVLFH